MRHGIKSAAQQYQNVLQKQGFPLVKKKKNDLNNLVERSSEESISEMTNLLHSAGKNEINVTDFVNNDVYIKYQENSLLEKF